MSQVLIKILKIFTTQEQLEDFLASQRDPSSILKKPYHTNLSSTSLFSLSEKTLLNKSEFLDEEAKLLESAQLALNLDSTISSYNDQKSFIRNILTSLVNESENCCDDCVNNYSTLNKILDGYNGLTPMEFNEFLRDVESVNCGHKQRDIDQTSEYYFKHEDMDTVDDFDAGYRNFEDKMCELSLTSPKRNILPKSDKRLHRNNSFRAAIRFKTPQNKFQVPDLEELDSPSPFLPIVTQSPQPPKKIMRSNTANTSDFKTKNFQASKSTEFNFKQPLPVLRNDFFLID